MNNRPHLVPSLVIAFLLLMAALPWPYGYYVFLRWVTCGMAAYTAYISYTWETKWALWVFIPIAILFNPIFPVYLTKAVWQPIDVVVAILFGSIAFILKKPSKTLKI